MKYRPYNKTFDKYVNCSMSKEEALEFIVERNQCKGGVYILHTEEQYLEWKEKPQNWVKESKLDELHEVIYPMQRAVYPKFHDMSIVVEPAYKGAKNVPRRT